MANANAVLDENLESNEDLEIPFDLDEFERVFESDLEEQLSDFELAEEEKEMIGNPDNLGKVVWDVVCDQVVNEIGKVAGEEFLKANNGLTLDLRDEAHIQTTKNFAKGKIATHNTKIDYQERYDNWQSNFVKDENGNVITHTTRSGTEEATLVKGARKPFDDKRPSGSVEKHTDMDHTVPAAEIIRDAGANAHMTKEEQIAFANSDANLYEMDSSLNRSKGDKSTTEWLDNSNSKGQKPNEIFDISEEMDKEMRQKDMEAREEYEKQKKEGEEKSIKAGKQSQKEEKARFENTVKNANKNAIRIAVMGLLAELLKDIIQKLISWFKSKEKSLETFIEHIKEAIHIFVQNLKNSLISAGFTFTNIVGTTIATAIIGPVVNTIKKVWMLFKQGAKSVKEAIQYIKNPENRNKPFSIKVAQVSKIITTGLAAGGAILLSEAIEKGLMTFPVLAFEIPLIGSLANIIGIFLGAVISGIIGAIVINLINKFIANRQKAEAAKVQVEKGNDVLNTQRKLIAVKEAQLQKTKASVENSITERHQEANNIIREAANNILNSDADEDLDEIYALLNNM